MPQFSTVNYAIHNAIPQFTMPQFRNFAIPLLLLLSLACSRPPAGKGAGEIETSVQSNTSFRIEKVVGGLQVPWSIVWAPDGRMIFTERAGRVRVVENGTLKPEPLFVIPDVEPSGESGLMSVALHPEFKNNHFLYLSYAYAGDGVRVRIVRYRETPAGFVDRKVIIEDIPAARFHAAAVCVLDLTASSTSRPATPPAVSWRSDLIRSRVKLCG